MMHMVSCRIRQHERSVVGVSFQTAAVVEENKTLRGLWLQDADIKVRSSMIDAHARLSV